VKIAEMRINKGNMLGTKPHTANQAAHKTAFGGRSELDFIKSCKLFAV